MNLYTKNAKQSNENSKQSYNNYSINIINENILIFPKSAFCLKLKPLSI